MGNSMVSGAFSSIGGQSHNYLARLDGTTGLADSYDAAADNVVRLPLFGQ